MRTRNPYGEFSRSNPLRRKEAIRRVKREYERSKRGRRLRLFNHEIKMNFLLNCRSQIGCKTCKEDNPIILCFHHCGMDEKLFSLTSMCATRSWKSILAEIKKCDVYCYNHHVLEHEKMPHHREGKKYQPRKKEIIYGVQGKLI